MKACGTGNLVGVGGRRAGDLASLKHGRCSGDSTFDPCPLTP